MLVIDAAPSAAADSKSEGQNPYVHHVQFHKVIVTCKDSNTLLYKVYMHESAVQAKGMYICLHTCSPNTVIHKRCLSFQACVVVHAEASVVLPADHASLQEASNAGQPAQAPGVLSQPEQEMQQEVGAPKGTASSQSQAPDTAVAAGSMSAAADFTARAQPAALPPVADMQALARRIGMTSRPTPQPVSQSAAHAAGSSLANPQQSHPQAHAVAPSKLISPTVSDPAAVPAEIQAIIRKLVLFIKVGPSGHVYIHQSLLCHAWHSPGPLPKQANLLCIRV